MSAPEFHGSLQKRAWEERKSQRNGVCWEIMSSKMSKLTLKVSTTWLPEQDMDTDDTSRHPNPDGVKFWRPQATQRTPGK
ncbi:rCG22541 [Rattus norvegicus]|uniref:RCG22541 n=1 Tax=Rattus norvegicus TaxID=10116 RepID=A6IP23_RAT|nr:rCG22541 [Rattus norvegicus]